MLLPWYHPHCHSDNAIAAADTTLCGVLFVTTFGCCWRGSRPPVPTCRRPHDARLSSANRSQARSLRAILTGSLTTSSGSLANPLAATVLAQRGPLSVILDAIIAQLPVYVKSA